jgi:signal transduction histidine kinase
LERRVTELDVLRWIGQAINFDMDIDDLMELIYAQTSRVIDTRNFSIALYNAESEQLVPAFYVRQGERLYRLEDRPTEVALSGAVVRTGRPMITADYAEACQKRQIEAGAHPFHAWMAVPLSASERILGVMRVASTEPGVVYSREEQQVFLAIADLAAAILNKARLDREMEARARHLTALNEVGSVLTSTLNLRTVLHLIMDKAVELLAAEAGSLILVDEDTGELTFEVTTGPGSADLEGVRLPPGTGVVGSVVDEGRSTIIRDAQSDQRWYRELDDSTEFVTRSIIAVPMISRGRVVGVIELLNRHDGVPFGEEDERLLSAFAAHAAISVENARLFTQTDQALSARVAELSMMQRIDRELNATLDYERVMRLTVEWAVRTTGASAGLIAAIVETEEGEQGMRFLAAQGYPESLIAAHREAPVSLERQVVGRVTRTGKPELFEGVDKTSDYLPILPGMAVQLAVPIRREERIIGVILLEAERKGVLDQEALDFVVRLADHAAIAMENAGLFEQVRRANDAKTEFVSFVSHELKQPMTSIKGYTDLLVKGVVGEMSEAQLNFMSTIRSNVERMNTLVSDLLDISRIESGRIQLKPQDVSIGPIIDDVLQATQQQIEDKEQELVVDVRPDLPLIHADRDRIVQVVTNLVSNACKYTPEGGQITVQAQKWSTRVDDHRESFVMCSVIDTGIGISPQDQKRMFTKYFRADDPTVRSVPGTGLGLVITKSLVELHGGEIWLTSEVGEGSTFTFTIPTVSGSV